MKLLLLFQIIIIIKSQLLYNLTISLATTIPLQSGEQILQIQNSQFNGVYAVVNWNQSFRVVNFDPNIPTSLIDSTQYFNASMNLSNDYQMNPTLYILNSQLLIIYKNGNYSEIGASQLFLNPNNFSQYYQLSIDYFFTASYLKFKDVLYFITQLGDQGYYDSTYLLYNNSNPIFTYLNPNSNINSTNQIRNIQVNNSYVVVTNLQDSSLHVAHVKNIAGIIDVSLSSYSIEPYYSICSGSFNNLMVHYHNGSIVTYFLFDFSFQSIYGPVVIHSQYCYYDSLTESIVLVDNTQIGNVIYEQYLLSGGGINNIVFPKNSNSTFIKAMTFLITGFQIITFQSVTCNNQLDYFTNNYTCKMCDYGCAQCSGLDNCLKCSSINFTLMNSYCCLPNQFVYVAAVLGVISKSCVNCTLPCIACNNLVCLQCDVGFDLMSNVCVSNITNSSNSSNGTNFINSLVVSNLLLDSLRHNYLIDAINRIPSIRSILKPILASFMCFDDLYLYQFHERDYGNTLNSLFEYISSLEVQKWQIFDTYVIFSIFESFKINKTQVIEELDDKLSYSSPKFVQLQNNGEGFLVNGWSFVTTNFIASTFIYLILRLLFRLLINFRISKILRVYSFKTYYPFFLLQGNLQIIIFYLTSSFILAFQIHANIKLTLVLNTLAFYSLVLFAFFGYPFIYSTYNKLTKYFTQNISLSCQTMIFLTIQFGLKNVLMGIIHNLFRSLSMFRIQLSVLLLIEAICLLNYAYFLTTKQFIWKYKICMYCLITGLRIALIVTLILQQSYFDDNQIALICETIISFIVQLYIIMLYKSLALNFIVYVIELKSLLCFKKYTLHMNRDIQLQSVSPSLDKIQAQNFPQKRILYNSDAIKLFMANSNYQVQLLSNRCKHNLKIKRGLDCKRFSQLSKI